MALIELVGLEKSFHNRKTGDTQVLRGIDLAIEEGQTVCVVGESGCGKTTLGKILAGLQGYTGGTYTYRGQEVASLQGKLWKQYRTDVQMIHQNPYESLNPTQMVFDIISAPIKHHHKIRDFAVLPSSSSWMRLPA
jgi:peptide/nickel transport system ATP-binding protein